MYNAKRVISHTQLLSQLNALFAFALLKAQAALFKVSTPFLCARLLVFKKDGQDLLLLSLSLQALRKRLLLLLSLEECLQERLLLLLSL